MRRPSCESFRLASRFCTRLTPELPTINIQFPRSLFRGRLRTTIPIQEGFLHAYAFPDTYSFDSSQLSLMSALPLVYAN